MCSNFPSGSWLHYRLPTAPGKVIAADKMVNLGAFSIFIPEAALNCSSAYLYCTDRERVLAGMIFDVTVNKPVKDSPKNRATGSLI